MSDFFTAFLERVLTFSRKCVILYMYMESDYNSNGGNNMEGHVINANLINFILGGNALFTVQEGKTQTTYKVTKSKYTYADGSTIFYCCIQERGSNLYFGYLKLNKNKLTFRYKSKDGIMSDDTRIRLLLNLIHMRKNLPETVKVFHCGKCACCGRKLTTVESIERGFGPECWKFITDTINNK